MKFTLPLVIGSSLLIYASSPAASSSEPEPGQVAISVGKALEQLHYTRHSLDNTISDRLLHTYIETLDFSRLFFTQKDIAEFEKKYDTELDDDIWLGDLSPAYVIYDTYVKRVEARVAKIKDLLKNGKFTFDSNRTIEISRQKSPWPKDEEEADALWHDRIENDLLTENLNQPDATHTADTSKLGDSDKPTDPAKPDAPKSDTAKSDAPKPDSTKSATAKAAVDHPVEKPEVVVAKRYDQLLRSIHEQTKEDESKFFLSSLAQSYDPHSEYLSPSEMENFSINMRLSLVGIGAMLRSEDGYSKIVELIAGGPAATEGELKIDDKIVGVAQGSEPFVDVVDMKLDKVVEMIRGKKGSVVRLQVMSAADPSKRKVIAITRDEVKLTEGEARAEIIEQKNDRGQTERLGWITLPSFYAEMDRVRTSHSAPKSTTRDVNALLTRLNKEGISGLVIDLRRNGGGSLEEAINLTGLFIKKGPVVQSKDYNKVITVSSDKDPSISYSGPMVVLTSHISASASEIFAGALQDYGRAVIVGDKNTFGKGTVQTLMEVGRIMSPFGLKTADAGALKLTIQKFYRPSGASTQLKGVESDIVLPSRYAHLDVGEASLKYPLPYDEVKPADYDKWPGPTPDLADLRARSAARVKADPEFKYLEAEIDKMDARMASNTISLNKLTRQGEIAAAKARTDEIKVERTARHQPAATAFQLALSDVDKPKLQRVNNEKKDAKGKDKAPATADPEDDALDDADSPASPDAVDPIKTESLNILSDLVDQQRRVKIAKVRD